MTSYAQSIKNNAPKKPGKGTIQIDIREGEFFYTSGTEIKKAIDARIQSVLRPAYEAAMNNITRLVGDIDNENVAALIVALQGDEETWNAATSEIYRNAEIADDHNEEIQELARMAGAFSDDAQYVVNTEQLERFGLGS